MKKRRVILFFILSLFLMGNVTTVQAASEKSVKLGRTISVYQKSATYKSSNTSVVYVDSDGIVTGKSVGTATVTVKKGNKSTKTKIKVKADAKKKEIKVCASELKVIQNVVTMQEPADSDAGIISLTVKNTGKYKVTEVSLLVSVGKTKYEIPVGSLAAGAEKTVTKEVTVAATTAEDISCTVLKKTLCSNKMIQVYNEKNHKSSLNYATKDTTPPVISGMVGKNSYCKKMPFRVVYSNDKKYDYFKNVKVTDDRDEKVELTVDTSKVNYKKEGTYVITYTAVDSAGNKATATAKISVRKKDSLDKMCDQVLKSIIKSSWSDKKKAKAIHNYTRSHTSYTGHSNKSSWEKEAKRGLMYGSGDCFTYYSVARALLTRAGIMNIEVRRVKGKGNHWWLKVYVSGGWYHLDACPRARGGRFNLVTDAQLKAYSKKYGNSHIWDYKDIPASPKKKLSSIF